MGKPQAWQRKRAREIEGPLLCAGAMLAEIIEELPRLCLAHRRLAPEAAGRTRGMLERLRAVHTKLSEVDLLEDELREVRSILERVRKERKQWTKNRTR